MQSVSGCMDAMILSCCVCIHYVVNNIYLYIYDCARDKVEVKNLLKTTSLNSTVTVV